LVSRATKALNGNGYDLNADLDEPHQCFRASLQALNGANEMALVKFDPTVATHPVKQPVKHLSPLRDETGGVNADPAHSLSQIGHFEPVFVFSDE